MVMLSLCLEAANILNVIVLSSSQRFTDTMWTTDVQCGVVTFPQLCYK